MLIDQIATDAIAARKSRDKLSSDLLTTLLSEARTVGKDARNGDPTDAETIAVVKKFLKNNDETIAVVREQYQRDKSLRERDLLMAYMPQQMSDDEIAEAIDSIMADHADRSPKLMGVVMKTLKERHEGLYDAKRASEIVKAKLA